MMIREGDTYIGKVGKGTVLYFTLLYFILLTDLSRVELHQHIRYLRYLKYLRYLRYLGR